MRELVVPRAWNKIKTKTDHNDHTFGAELSGINGKTGTLESGNGSNLVRLFINP